MNIDIKNAEQLLSPSDRPEILPGRAFWRGDRPCQLAPLDSVWSGFKPDRYPAVIVQPESAQEVVLAVPYAARYGMKARATSGGHNWTAFCCPRPVARPRNPQRKAFA